LDGVGFRLTAVHSAATLSDLQAQSRAVRIDNPPSSFLRAVARPCMKRMEDHERADA
jgi:hypothetical protein